MRRVMQRGLVTKAHRIRYCVYSVGHLQSLLDQEKGLVYRPGHCVPFTSSVRYSKQQQRWVPAVPYRAVYCPNELFQLLSIIYVTLILPSYINHP